jgi:hypothetical protein
MAFVVRADSGKLGEVTFLVDEPTKYAAVETALDLIRQGMISVTIMGDDGRIYTHSEFLELIGEEQ